jgi:polyisoprenoid-binding protein YceI
MTEEIIMHKRIGALLLLSLLAILATACGVLQEVEEPSAPLEAVPLEVATTAPEPSEAAPEPTAAPTEVPATEAPDETPTEAPPTEAPPTEPAPAEEAPAGELLIYQISQADSQVRFELDEELRGQPKTVVGVTDQIAGEIAVNLSDLSTTQVGVILINARTLTTDNNFRNRAINNEILDTGAYEFITFTPSSVDGLPAGTAVGEEVTFTISGDLTIRDITNPVTFEVVATAVSETQLSGTASAIVSRADYDLRIPEVPNVANVEETVELYIDFVANAA